MQMLAAAAAALLVFDGRDVADAVPSDEEVIGYPLVPCQVCGTERGVRCPCGGESAGVGAAERALVARYPPRRPVVGHPQPAPVSSAAESPSWWSAAGASPPAERPGPSSG